MFPNQSTQINLTRFEKLRRNQLCWSSYSYRGLHFTGTQKLASNVYEDQVALDGATNCQVCMTVTHTIGCENVAILVKGYIVSYSFFLGIHDSRKQCGPESHGCYNVFQISTNVSSTMATAHKPASISKVATGVLVMRTTRSMSTLRRATVSFRYVTF